MTGALAKQLTCRPGVWLAVAFCIATALPSTNLEWHRTNWADTPWRWLTAHLVHIDLAHLLNNLLAIAVLVAVTRQTAMPRLLEGATMLAAALTIAVCLSTAAPSLATYAGGSGLLYALATLHLGWEWQCARQRRQGHRAALLGVVFMLLIGFVLHDNQSTPRLLSESSGAIVASAAHLIGCLTGSVMLVVAFGTQRARRLIAQTRNFPQRLTD